MDGTVYLLRNQTFYNLLGYRPDINRVKVDGIQGNDGTIFVPGQLRQMVSINGKKPMEQFEIATEGIYTSRVHLVGGKKARSYELVSEIPLFDEVSLRKIGCGFPGSCFYQLPSSLPQRVRDLATWVTRQADTDYDRVKAVESFLKKSFPYDMIVPHTPAGRDIVDYFLFDLKRGYCSYFSTAMAVMLRSIEIPACWVKGFLASEGVKQKRISRAFFARVGICLISTE